jgi:hypothetical protein
MSNGRRLEGQGTPRILCASDSDANSLSLSNTITEIKMGRKEHTFISFEKFIFTIQVNLYRI